MAKAFLLCSTLLLVHRGSGKDCGPPGWPLNGSALSSEKFFYPGESVSFACRDGFVLFGHSTRECGRNGQWTNALPTCQRNLALGKPSSQSETLWSYSASLAVDGDANTCSFTPQSDSQRWWQVHLEKTLVIGKVGITLSPGSYQKFSLFVVQISDEGKAVYRQCANFDGRFQESKKVFKCNEGHGHRGEFVYVRDDRDDREYFGICELEVFAHQEMPECGRPEQPLYGDVALNEDGLLATYTCFPGFGLIGNRTRSCGFKGWTGTQPECDEVHCEHPESTEDGFIEVSNFKGSYVYGSKASYKCNPGFILWGNTTRLCDSRGQWTGSKPLCRPIACPNPRVFEHASVALINASTTVDSLAAYECLQGYRRENSNDSSQILISKCLKTGIWSQINFRCVEDETFFEPLDKLGYNEELRERFRNANSSADVLAIAVVVLLAAVIALLAILFAAALLRKGLACNRGEQRHAALESGGAKFETSPWIMQQQLMTTGTEIGQNLNNYSTLPISNPGLATLADGCVTESTSLHPGVVRGQMIDVYDIAVDAEGSANDAFSSVESTHVAPLVCIDKPDIMPDILPRPNNAT